MLGNHKYTKTAIGSLFGPILSIKQDIWIAIEESFQKRYYTTRLWQASGELRHERSFLELWIIPRPLTWSGLSQKCEEFLIWYAGGGLEDKLSDYDAKGTEFKSSFRQLFSAMILIRLVL